MQSKATLKLEVASLSTKVEMLKERVQTLQDEKSELMSQIVKLSDALVAREAPQAYMDQHAELYEETPEEKSNRKKFDKSREVVGEYLRGIEEPLFKDPTEMASILLKGTDTDDIIPPSLHENEES